MSRPSRSGRLVARAVATFLAAVPVTSVSPARAATPGCPVGAYRLSDGRTVDVAPADGEHYRWRLEDGTTGLLERRTDGRWTSTAGWTGRPDGRLVGFDCARSTVDFAGTRGRRLDFAVTETRFRSGGADLAGRLVMPVGNGPVPVVVLVHGAERDSALEGYALQRLFPSAGIGAFVYDKRGTGSSTGHYTQDFLMLANDATAAMHEARRLAGSRAGRVGFQAGSQGGWVAPLAARIEPVDFLVVGFGLAVSPLEEDREAIALDVTRRGHGPEVLARAMEVADATAQVLTSDFREGYDAVEAVKKRYGAEPWFTDIHGNVSFAILGKTPDELRKIGPELLPNTPWQYDPVPVLRNLSVPQLWILGAEDIDAPSASTVERLKELAARGRPVTTVLFPDAEHGIYEFETRADGTRVDTRQPEAYFGMMRDFITTGRLGDKYSSARILTRAARPEDWPRQETR